ncbi:MAG: alkaline phosphatase [Sedimentisphaerales bacterium]|nr:alkaline phosphatase [Sedimentisphaerales bacterium]
MASLKNVILCLVCFSVSCAGVQRGGLKPDYVNHNGSEKFPKNVIIFIADGAGFNHFKAADFYQCGNSPCQEYADFPVRLAMSTYQQGGDYNPNAAWAKFNYVKHGYTDSAAAATAMATGVKTYNYALGVDVNRNPVTNLVERAEQLGKSTGVITSVPFSHATPAGFVAHNTSRNNYTQIADDMVNKSAADVIMGCGHPLYDNDGKQHMSTRYKYLDSSNWVNLLNGSAGADADGDGSPDPWTLIQARAQFQALAKGPAPKRLFGLARVFETLQEKRSPDARTPYESPFIQTVPTLEEMTLAALNVLDDNPAGFFLMIEGGAVDWAAHNNHSARVIEEMNDFNRSAEAVIKWVKRENGWNETLVIVTADHETGYLTGPDAGGSQRNELVNNGPGKMPSMEWNSGSHTNSLVPFYAKGSGAKYFKDAVDGNDPVHGPYIDNTDIANVIFSLWRD